MAVVNIRGDRLYHEHITWDQATALRQVGHLPEFLPFGKHDIVVNGRGSHANEEPTMEIRLPVAGTQTARKMRDKNSVSSNEMFGWGVRTIHGA